MVEENKALAVAKWLKEHGITPDIIYAAPLLRTMQTATIIKNALHINDEIIEHNDFVEIDYGPDENKTENEVIERLGLLDKSISLSESQIIKNGKFILQQWDNEAIVPHGWKVDVNKIISDWKDFVKAIPDNSKILICSSNGIIRFAPHILGDKYSEFVMNHNLKVATGSISIFSNHGNEWNCDLWNLKP